MMTFVQLRQVFEDFIAHVQQRGDYVVEDVWPDTTGGLAVWAFKGERTLSLVKLLAMSGSERTMLEIAGGGAAGLPHAPEVYEYVATTMYDFGALWANRMPDGTVTVGSRVTIPSDVLDHNSDDIG